MIGKRFIETDTLIRKLRGYFGGIDDSLGVYTGNRFSIKLKRKKR